MASLVTVTREGRIFLKVGGLIFAVLMVVYIFIKGGSLIRDVFFPKPPPPPEQAFGKLPKIVFSQNASQANITYTVNTVDGLLPNLGDRINVYKIKSKSPDLLALNEAKNTLDSANFVEGQTKISDTVYRWTQSRTGVVIEYDIVNNNFTIFSNYLTNPTIVSSGILPSEEAIISDTKGFLKTINANTANLNLDNMTVEYLQIENGLLVAAQSLGQARLARVTINQNPIDEVDIVYGNPEGSLTTFVISYPGSRYQVLEGLFYNYEPDIDEKSDYPIKTTQQALEKLKNGEGNIMNPQNLTNVDITSVELKYYLNRNSSEFLLPIFVFEGVNFKGFVEALADNSISTDGASLQEVQN